MGYSHRIRIIFKHEYLIHRWYPSTPTPSQREPRVKPIKGFFTLLISQEVEPHRQIKFWVISNLLERDLVSLFEAHETEFILSKTQYLQMNFSIFCWDLSKQLFFEVFYLIDILAS